MIKRFSVLIIMLFTVGLSSAHADNAEGEKAYASGDYVTALKEFTEAAENGDMYAQFNLGVMYEHGHGVDQSDLKAGEWYQIAADNGHPEAPMALQLLYEYF